MSAWPDTLCTQSECINISEMLHTSITQPLHGQVSNFLRTLINQLMELNPLLALVGSYALYIRDIRSSEGQKHLNK